MVSSFITSTYVSINVIIWSICIGANLAVLFGYFSKNYTGVFIRRLLDSGTGEENARTIYDLGLEKQFAIRIHISTRIIVILVSAFCVDMQIPSAPLRSSVYHIS